jgi:hypothetical protein
VSYPNNVEEMKRLKGERKEEKRMYRRSSANCRDGKVEKGKRQKCSEQFSFHTAQDFQ